MDKKDEKLKNGNSLETQFWNDNIEIDTSTEFMQEVKKMWEEFEEKKNNEDSTQK